ncbi:ATP-grasp domain-containing protein [Glaciecola sp. 1036]|uniref:ATP-grasp domain-containing protein n=1 Tax=Alteromonadaceae TaxID=72275 RepID=UPI003D075E39
MRLCAFLSTDNLEDFFVYDDLVKPHLQKLGWQVEDVFWRNKTVDYNQFDLVVVRSTWDYQQDSAAFLECLERIDDSTANLQNPLSLMRWNLSKAYLHALASAGVPVLPTIWAEGYSEAQILESFDQLNTPEIVIKPLISANADFTYRLSKKRFMEENPNLSEIFRVRPFMIQSFEPSIAEKGEYSLFYFAGQYSHAILKRPKAGDFRVQEEHGGQLEAITPTSDMLKLGALTLEALPTKTLYARVDMLETQRGLEIIEVELIEPSLYFNMDKNSALRFAHAINDFPL